MFVQYNALYMDHFMITVTNATRRGSHEKRCVNHIYVRVTEEFKLLDMQNEVSHISTFSSILSIFSRCIYMFCITLTMKCDHFPTQY